jgi:amylovoran biosynthesis glycosyltransferase AmsD
MEQEKKSIYIIINDISKIGGLSKVALNLYNEFKKAGYKIKIITGNLDENNEKYYYKVKNDIINLNLGSVHKISNNKFKLIKWYYNYYKALKKLNIKKSTIISIETVINFITVLSLNKKNKVIGTEHLSFKRRQITQLIKKILYPDLYKLIVLTKTDKKLYNDFGLNNVEVIPNFIYPSEKVSNLNNKRILFVAKLEKIKGVDLLVEIIKQVNNKEWKFVIVGDGIYREYLKKELKSYNVEIKGQLLDVEKVYLNSDIFILTSRKEGFPMVLLEAKNYGLPVVSFDIPTGPKEMIKDGEDGFLIPFKDIDLFVEKLNLLINDEELLKNMAEKSKKSVYQYYPQKVMQQWFQII